MAYVDAAFVGSVHGSLARLRETAGGANDTEADARIATAITAGESEADSYLLTRYEAVMADIATTTPPVLQLQVARLVIWQLAGMRDLASDKVRIEYEDALSWFNRLARGTVSLNIATRPAVDVTVPVVATNGSEADLVFSRGQLDNWGRH